jgi:hypothetical protein
MLIALLAVLGVDLIVIVALVGALLGRRRWLKRQPGRLRRGDQGLLRSDAPSPAATAYVAAQLEGEGHQVLSEREIEATSAPRGQAGHLRRVSQRSHHRPDLAVLPAVSPLRRATEPPARSRRDRAVEGQGTQGGPGRERSEMRERAARTEDAGMRSVPATPIAIEVELTNKSARRLDEILRPGGERLSPSSSPARSRGGRRVRRSWFRRVVPPQRRGGPVAGLAGQEEGRPLGRPSHNPRCLGNALWRYLRASRCRSAGRQPTAGCCRRTWR